MTSYNDESELGKGIIVDEEDECIEGIEDVSVANHLSFLIFLL